MNSQSDYKKILAPHRMQWGDFPHTWFEGPFLGNGSTGVSVFFTEENQLYFNIGNTDVYDNRDNSGIEQNMLFLTPRLPLGGFLIETPEGFVGNQMCLSLYDGDLQGTLTDGQGKTDFDCFVAEGQRVIFLHWTGKNVTLRYDPAPALSPRQYKMLSEQDKRMSLHYPDPKPPKTEQHGDCIIHRQPKFCGGEYRVIYRIFKENNDNTLVCLIENYEIGEIPAEGAPAKIEALYRNRAALKAEHRNFWHGFYPKSYLSLDDKELEKFYWIQLYKCAAATRKGYHVYDTAGPWLGKYTAWPAEWWNLNVELNYSPLYPANHTEIAESLPETLEREWDVLRENVPLPYRNGTYCTIGRNATSTLKTPCGIPGECTVPNDLELGNLIWALHNCYVHLKSDCDHARIKNLLFPMLKGATEYITEFLREEADGELHLPPTTSPEYQGISEDCSYNLSLLMWGLKTLIKLNGEYGLQDANCKKWEQTLQKLAPLPTHPTQGIMIGRNYPLATSHRHYSHLLAFYPLHIMDETNPAQRELIEKSIAHWQSMPEGLQGYSCTGSASMYAYLGDGDKALVQLKKLFAGFIRPNTMYHEDLSPVLETPPAAARTILDMVFISLGEEIRVFTGTPSCWQDVEFAHLLAENGCLVSAKREKGKTVFVSLTAKEECTVTLLTDLIATVLPANATPAKGGYVLHLGAGETAVLKRNSEIR